MGLVTRNSLAASFDIQSVGCEKCSVQQFLPFYQEQAIKMQQNHLSKQMKADSVTRQRPLQKSMLLPQTQIYPTSPTRGTPLQFAPYTPMKKSLISNQQIPHNNPNMPYAQNSHPSFNQAAFLQNSPPYESRISSQNQTAHQSYILKGLLSPFKNQIKSEQSPQDVPRHYSKYQKPNTSNNEMKGTQGISTTTAEVIIQQIVSQLKQKHLPSMLSKLKKQVYDDIHNIRLEFQSLRDEVRSSCKKQDNLLNDFKTSQGNIINYNNNITHFGAQKQRHEKEEQFAQLQTHYFLLQGKLSLIEAKMTENSKMVLQQFEKLNLRLQNEVKNGGSKAGLVKSNLSPIMIQYRESFFIEKVPNIAKHRQQIIINHCLYFIDKFGFLMDHQNHYLIDNHGTRIKLEQKHLKILQTHRILQKSK